MTQLPIPYGSAANDGTGIPWRTAWQRTQDNFTDLYGRTYNVLDYGAVGTGSADDYASIQLAIDAAEADVVSSGNARVYLPPGDYAVSASPRVTAAGIEVVCDGTIKPYAAYAGFLFSCYGLATPSPGSGRLIESEWYANISIRRMNLDGNNQAKGLLVRLVDHGMFQNILIERVNGGAGIQCISVRESDFVNVVMAGCDFDTEAGLYCYEPNTSAGEPSNNLRFYGLNIVYCGGKALYVDTDTLAGGSPRNFKFFGAQLHYLDASKSWASIDNSVKFIHLRMAQRMAFVGCNLRLGTLCQGTCIHLGDSGDATRTVGYTNFDSCMVTGEGTGATGMNLERTTANISACATWFLMSAGSSFAGTTANMLLEAFGLSQFDDIATFLSTIRMETAAGTVSTINWRNRTDSTTRWVMGKNNTAEGGANAGSDFLLNRHDDAGTFIATALLVHRSTGKLTVSTSASAGASMRIPHGSAPSSPVDGDVWTTTSGLFVRINGSTVGPLS